MRASSSKHAPPARRRVCWVRVRSPWSNEAGMSSYRVGDFFWGNLHWRERLELICTHRDSLAADYFRTHASHSVQPRHRISSAGDAIAALAASAVRICSNCSLPPDIEASVALHLRVGDVICGSSLAQAAIVAKPLCTVHPRPHTRLRLRRLAL